MTLIRLIRRACISFVFNPGLKFKRPAFGCGQKYLGNVFQCNAAAAQDLADRLQSNVASWVEPGARLENFTKIHLGWLSKKYSRK